MEKERYKIIKLVEHKEWIKDAPIKIDKSQLLFDTEKNTTLLQIKMINLSEKTIKSVYVDVNCFDDTNKFIKAITDVTYLLIEAQPQTDFGDKQPVLLESLQIARVEIFISKVIFTDGMVWNNFGKETGIILGEQEVIDHNNELYEQVKREFIGKKTPPCYWFESSEDYWRCTCGQANSHKALICGCCGLEKAWLEKHLNKDYLLEQASRYQEAELQQRKKEEEYNQKKAEEELRIKKQQQDLIAQRNIKVKKITQKIMIAISLMVVIIVANAGYKNILKPLFTYNKAMSLFDNKDYGEAIEAFSNMSGYKNSQEMVTKSIYQYGIKLFESGEYEPALQQFSRVESYEDTGKYIIECHYNIGSKLMNDKKWEEAVDHLFISKKYEDSYNKIHECFFQIANSYMIDKEWKKALDAFNKVDGKAITEDLNAAISEAYYQYGLSYASASMWDEAISCMKHSLSNGEYKDAKSLIDTYRYNIEGNKLLSQYDEAIKFEENGRLDLAYNIYNALTADYKDCGQRMNKIKDYINLCGEYKGEVEYFAKTMQPTNYIASLSKAEIAITFDHDIPVINITISSAGGSVNYKDELQNMPISDINESGISNSKTVIRFTRGILYKDYYVYKDSQVTTILKFKKL